MDRVDAVGRPDVTVDAGPAGVRLAWDEAGNGEEAYVVERRLPGGGWHQVARLPGDAAGFADRRFENGTEYRVRGEGGGRLGPWSRPVVAEATTPNVTTFGRGTITIVRGDEHIDLFAAAGDAWGFEDEVLFRGRTVTGDFDVAVRVARLDGDGLGRTAGLMIRASDDPGAANVFVKARPGDVRMTARRFADGQTAAVAGAAADAAERLAPAAADGRPARRLRERRRHHLDGGRASGGRPRPGTAPGRRGGGHDRAPPRLPQPRRRGRSVSPWRALPSSNLFPPWRICRRIR